MRDIQPRGAPRSLAGEVEITKDIEKAPRPGYRLRTRNSSRARLFLDMAKNKRISVEVVVEKAARYVVSHYADGTETRTLVDPNRKLRRKPRSQLRAPEPTSPQGLVFDRAPLGRKSIVHGGAHQKAG